MFDLERAKKEGAITRDGRKVRIICDNRVDSNFPVVALVESISGRSGGEGVVCYHADGSFFFGSDENSLMNLPRKVDLFVATTELGGVRVYESEAAAVAHNMIQRRNGYAAGYAPATITLNR